MSVRPVMDDRIRFRRDYAPAFLQYLSEEGEPGLRVAYELGRRAMTDGLSMLELAEIHHAELLSVLRTVRTPEELDQIASAASRFFVELLATFEMVQRGFAELRQTTEQHRADAHRLNAEPQRLVTLHQGIGMLMERHGLEADAALHQMQQLAQRTGIPVEEVAAQLVRRLPVPPADQP
jgi:hypothetical protein